MPLTTLVLPAPTPSPTSPPPIYTLILSSPPDHRLTPELIASFLGHLDDIERDWRERRAIAKERAKKEGVKGYLGLGGSVVIRGEGEKFFSNGQYGGEGKWGRGGEAESSELTPSLTLVSLGVICVCVMR